MSAAINGGGNTVDVTGLDARVTTTGGTVNIFRGENGETIYANNEILKLGNYVDVDIVGSHDTILGSSNDTVVGQGQYDLVSANASIIDFAPTGPGSTAGDDVEGSGDSGNYYTYIGPVGGDSGLGTIWSSSGATAGTTRQMNVVGQYDLSHGYTAAAAAADAAWARSAQAIMAATGATDVLPPSVFNGARWTQPVINWSFATNTGPSSAPFSGYIQPSDQAGIEQAFQTWGKATGLQFQQVADSAISNIRIGWGSFDTGISGTIGYTSFGSGSSGELSCVTIRLEDPAQDAIVAGQGNALAYAGTQTELYQVALHEIGRALGLGESSDPSSVMFPELGPNNTTLDATDLKNIAVLYAGGTGALVGSSAPPSSFLAIDPGLLGAPGSMIAGSAVH